jgi:subtilisin family serine protease
MKKFLRFLPVVSLVLGLIVLNPLYSPGQVRPAVVSGKVLVKFAPDMASQLSTMRVGKKNGYIQTGLRGFDVLAYKHQTTALKRVFPDNPKKAEAHRKHGLHLWYELTVPINKDVESIAREFKGVRGIIHAEPIHAKAMINPGKPTLVKESAASITSPVNDPFFYLQWHYENDGVTNDGIVEGDINLIEAWKTQTGNPNVVVSVHDLGIDVRHKDLAANMWVNIAEKNGRPGVDDDFNGYVDDINGYDFSDDNGNVPPGDHGTHVGGTIAAVTNNGIGVSGIAGGDGTHPGVRLMTAKILNGTYDNIAASYVYAADNGAVISQNSWGYSQPGSVDLAVLDAIDYFIEEAGNFPNSPMKGGIVIFAAGNSASDLDFYPARYDRVLSVAALARNNQRAIYSNYGHWVDIAAPGGDQISGGMDDGVLSTLPNNQYGFFQGTSMACPHVSGIAALIVSAYGGGSYTAQDLWTALVTGTHDINPFNPDYQNQLGAGYVDAALALKKNNRIAPAKVSDLAIAEIGQDYLNIGWSAAADEDDGMAFRYEVIFGKDSIDVATRKGIKSHWVNESLPAGEAISVSLPNLFPNTRYYVAVDAFDRWGNKSPVSTIVSAITTAGPSISLDKSSLEFTIDVNAGTVAADNFNIINSAAGDLKWKAEVRQKNYYLDWNSVRYPAAGTTPVKAKMGRHLARGTSDKKSGVTTLGYHDDYQERAIRYIENEWSFGYMIGEEDTTITNSAATRFTVSYADGFNLTDINMLLNHNSERGDPPFVVEVYRGEELDKTNLVYAAEYSGYTNWDAVYDIQLSQQLFFEYGETFWVAVHMPAGHLYPLGINEETQSEYSRNCYISFDVGKSWSRLEDLIPYDFYAWVHVPISRTPGLDHYLTLEPGEGTVAGSNQQETSVIADATKLINGTYNADIVVLNNDFENRLASMPATITVTGQKPVLTSEPILAFGSVFTGTTKELVIDLENKGYGNFIVNSITTSHADFQIIEPPYNISALGKSILKVKFKPSAAALRNASLILEDQHGIVHKINLVGTGIAPSKIAIAPASASYTMAIGQEKSGTFKITNTGSYPLQFFAPKYASGDGIDYVDNGFNKFGYTYRTSTDGSGLTYAWEDISSTGTEMGEFFKDVANNRFYPVNLGFDFPIFNKTTDKLMITRYGILTIDDQVNLVGNSIQIGSEYMPFGFISALNQSLSLEGGGKLYYQAKSGKFIVQYENVRSAFDENQFYTFQIIVYDNGNVKINYKDISTLDSWNLNYMEVAIEDPDKNAGYLISNYDRPLNASSNFSVEIVSPGANIITKLSTAQATLGVGESMNINYDISSALLTEGTFWQNLVIVSNDPVSPAKMFKVNVTVNSGGVANVIADPDTIDLGEIFVGETAQVSLQVQNTGTKAAQITSVTSDHGYFTITKDPLPITIKAKSSSYIQLKLTGESPSLFEDIIHINTTAGMLTVRAKVTVVNPPAIALTYDPISDVLQAGQSAIHPIEIKNTGTAELQVVPSGPSWAYMVPDVAPGSAGVQYPKNTYYWTKSTQNGGPTYVWEEIMDKSNKLDFTMEWGIWEEKEIELPFMFNFYGKDYNKIYVNPKGVILFTPGQEPAHNFPARTIPDNEAPNNYIAPYWGAGYYDALYNDIWGVYAKVSEDVVIVEYVNYINEFFMDAPWHFQVLLYRNGNIKFQYNLDQGLANTRLGTIGVENENGSDGVRVAAFQNFIEDKLAVMLVPANRLDIAAGESVMMNLKVDASQLFGGEYTGNLLMQTNVPGSTNLEIPLNLIVNGVSHLAVGQSIDMGEVVGYEKDGVLKTFSKEFTIGNDGSATLDISQLQLGSGENFSLWMEFSDWFGNYWDLVPPDFAFSLTPKTSKKFKIEVTPVPGEYLLTDSLIITNNSAENLIKVPVKADVILPAVMSIDKSTITFVAPDHNFTGADAFAIDNSEGQSVLNYSMSVKYKRTGKAAFSSSQKLSGDMPRLSVVKNNRLTPSVTSVEGYNRTLEYSDAQESEGTIGFGIGMMFVSGTKYLAPADGFTLSHILTHYSSGNLAKSTITLGVYVGEDVTHAKLVYAKAYNLSEETVGKNFAGNVLLDIESPVHFYPGETFWIALWHPFGADHPQGYNLIDDTMKGTFLYYVPDFGVWGDITDDPSFRKVAWSVKALEKDFVNGNWLTIEPMQGQVPAGESSTINLSASASDVADTDTYAEVTITSNAVSPSTAKVLVNLHMNQAPQFGESSGYWTDEMSPLVFTVPVEDLEGDNITFNITDAPDGLTFKAVDGGVEIKYTPDYTSAGVKEINIHAKDAGNRESVQPVSIAVYNVNRQPVLVSNADRDYDYGSGVDEISTSEIISDPDSDDVLLVSVLSSDNDIAEVMASADKIRIKPKKPGDAVMTVTVTDTYGATLSTTVKITVNLITAIETPYFGNVKIYPNPAQQFLHVDFEDPSLVAKEICITDIAGHVLKQTSAGSKHAPIDVSGLAPGMYIIRMSRDEHDHTFKFIKR